MKEEELEKYYSMDRIECLICGEKFKVLNRHIIFKHKITPYEYKQKFNLPIGKGLCCKVTHNRKKEIAKKTYNEKLKNNHNWNNSTKKACKVKKRKSNFRDKTSTNNFKGKHREKLYTIDDFKEVCSLMIKENIGIMEAINKSGKSKDWFFTFRKENKEAEIIFKNSKEYRKHHNYKER